MLQHTRSCAGWRSWTCSNSGPGAKARAASRSDTEIVLWFYARCIPHRRRFHCAAVGTLAISAFVPASSAARSELTNYFAGSFGQDTLERNRATSTSSGSVLPDEADDAQLSRDGGRRVLSRRGYSTFQVYVRGRYCWHCCVGADSSSLRLSICGHHLSGFHESWPPLCPCCPLFSRSRARDLARARFHRVNTLALSLLDLRDAFDGHGRIRAVWMLTNRSWRRNRSNIQSISVGRGPSSCPRVVDPSQFAGEGNHQNFCSGPGWWRRNGMGWWKIDHVKVVPFRCWRAHRRVTALFRWKAGVVRSATLSADLRSLLGAACSESPEPVVMKNFQSEGRLHPSGLLQEHGIVSWSNAPVLIEGVVWGCSGGRQTRQR